MEVGCRECRGEEEMVVEGVEEVEGEEGGGGE